VKGGVAISSLALASGGSRICTGERSTALSARQASSRLSLLLANSLPEEAKLGMSRSSTAMVAPARSTKPAPSAPLELPGYTRMVRAATGLTQAVRERALEARAREHPATPGHERALAVIKNSAHPSTGRRHRFGDRHFSVACRHEDGRYPADRTDVPGRQMLGIEGADAVLSAGGPRGLGRIPAGGRERRPCSRLSFSRCAWS
jgi:hypothetical protein